MCRLEAALAEAALAEVAGGAGGASAQRLQAGFDRRSARFQKGRQREPLAELLDRLVGGKAGPVGGDLEQDSIRLAE